MIRIWLYDQNGNPVRLANMDTPSVVADSGNYYEWNESAQQYRLKIQPTSPALKEER